jgi:putative ABC transport system permease protein
LALIGKVISINGKDNFMVQGVFKNIPENSHIKFEALMSLTTLADVLPYDTEPIYRFPTYLLIDGKTDIKKVLEKLVNIQTRYIGDKSDKLKISLQPVRDAHLHSFDFKHDTQIRGSNTVVQFLMITACSILILAWINYINLSTARAVKRAKEVGIRKVIGAKRNQPIWQFLVEAFLINLISPSKKTHNPLEIN